MISPKSEILAAYQYDAFGRTVDMAGEKAAENSWRFSTKPLDFATGWYYYIFRDYIPESGRWASKDSIEELGGVNLYGFTKNRPLNASDTLGLVDEPCVCCIENFKINLDRVSATRDANANNYTLEFKFTTTATLLNTGTRTFEGKTYKCKDSACLFQQDVKASLTIQQIAVALVTAHNVTPNATTWSDDKYSMADNQVGLPQFSTNDRPQVPYPNKNVFQLTNIWSFRITFYDNVRGFATPEGQKTLDAKFALVNSINQDPVFQYQGFDSVSNGVPQSGGAVSTIRK